MKLYVVENESWWVPANHPRTMAVRIKSPEQYLSAVRRKIRALAERMPANDLARVARMMSGAIQQIDPELIVDAALEQVALAERVKEGDPAGGANPADEYEAREAIKAQRDITLEMYIA